MKVFVVRNIKRTTRIEVLKLNRKAKIAIILLGYVVVFILTFIFTGGLEALIQFATEGSQAIEGLIRELIERIREALS